MVIDIRAHSEVSSNYPQSPAYLDLFIGKNSRKPLKLISNKDGSLADYDGIVLGTWWGHSPVCVELALLENRIFLAFDDGNRWESPDHNSRMVWTRKRERESGVSRTPARSSSSRGRNQSPKTPNLSRFRMLVLPIDPLDYKHKDQLKCMGLRVCFHAEVGRVLVSTREFKDGDVVIFSKVSSTDVRTDQDVLELVDPTHPSCCYLLVPRLKKLYYNGGSFSDEDPIQSGDLWYLVNHSPRPNTEVVLRSSGIQLKAKRAIQPNEPITWTYPHGFFGKDEVFVDLPQNILPDDVVPIRE
jgi:hypothetical protein